MPGLEDFFAELDEQWPEPSDSPVTLRLLGSTALFLQTTYDRNTKDSDVLETDELRGPLKQKLLRLAGKGTRMHRRHRIYLEILAHAFPFLPQQPRFHPVALRGAELRHVRLVALDVVDVAVSKLARLNADDVADLDAMIDRGKVSHDHLVERFKLAFDWLSGDARACELPRYVDNLHQVERDLFGLEHETFIDLSELKY